MSTDAREKPAENVEEETLENLQVDVETRPQIHIGFRDDAGNPTGPTDVQILGLQQFRLPEVQFLLLDGGTKGGKTSDAIYCALEYGLQHPGLNVLLGHLDLNSLNSSLLYHLNRMVPEKVDIDGAEVKIRFDDHKKQRITVIIPGFTHPTAGYTIAFDYRPLDPSRDLHERVRISGASYGIIILDQAENMSFEVLDACITRLSQPPFKVILTANPDPDQWFYRPFVERIFDDPTDAQRFSRVTMNPGDNRYVDPRYIEMLARRLPKALQDRYIRGKYERLRGMILNDEIFNYEQHVFDPEYPIPSTHHIYTALDPGFADPTAVQFWSVDRENVHYLWECLTLRNATPFDVSRETLTALERLLNRGRNPGDAIPRIIGYIADPSSGKRNAEGKPLSAQLAEYVHPNGWRITVTLATSKGLNRREVKKQRAMLVQTAFKQKKVKIARTCSDWFAQRRQWVWDDKKERPADFRVMAADGTVVHHFDHMDAMLYFESWVNRNADKEREPNKPRDRYRWFRQKSAEQNNTPLQRFIRT